MKTKQPGKSKQPSFRIGSVLSYIPVLAAMILLTLIVSCSDDEDTSPTELTISGISPNTGGEGTVVEITGTGFSATASQNSVTLNDNVCPVTGATTTKLTITIPADAGSGNLVVTVGSNSVQSGLFTFVPDAPELSIASILPTSGPKGTLVTITGTGFSTTAANNTVTLNGNACQVSSATATQLGVIIPAGAGSGVIEVTTGGTTVESQTFEFEFTIMVTTLAGSSSGLAEGTGSEAQFNQPYTVAADADGNVYVADASNHRIRKITPAGVVTTFAGSTQGDADGTGAAAQFNYPYGVATDADGNVYVADTHNHKLKKITPAGVVTTLAGSTGGAADGSGSEAQFYYLTGVAVDANGNIYVADKDNNRIRKVSPAGDVITLAGSTSGFAEGTGSAAQFSSPYNVAVDGDGNVYVADANNHRIRKVTQAGVVTTLAGSTQGDAVGTGAEALFNYPYGVTTDADGNVYIADTFNQKVKKITPGGNVTVLTGTTNGSADGDVETAQFNYLTGIAAGATGIFYVADKDNHRIRVVTVD